MRFGFSFQLTNYCEKNCEHCCNSSTVKGKPLPYDVFLDVLNRQPSYSIAFTGGEPLLYQYEDKDFSDVVNEAEKRSLVYTWMCGGITKNKHYEKVLKKIKGTSGNIVLSFNLFRDRPVELFHHTVKLLKKYELNVYRVSVISSPYNESKTTSLYHQESKDYPWLPDPTESIVIPSGRARFLPKPEEEWDFTCKPDTVGCNCLSLSNDGLYFPCGAVLSKYYFMKHGWDRFTWKDDIEEVEKAAVKFCKSCPARKGFLWR